jgi:hypothetical protein
VDLRVIDDFLDDPDSLRAWALTQEYEMPEQFYGMRSRSKGTYDTAGYRQRFEKALGGTTSNFIPVSGGAVWLSLADDQDRLPGVHADDIDPAAYGALLYLTPGGPADCGTSFWRNRMTGLERVTDLDEWNRNGGGPLDLTSFEEVERVEYLYNRVVVYPLNRLHSATRHFGVGIGDGRMHTMFWYVE